MAGGTPDGWYGVLMCAWWLNGINSSRSITDITLSTLFSELLYFEVIITCLFYCIILV